MYSFPYLEPVCCSMLSSNCCFLTCIQISQEHLGVCVCVCIYIYILGIPCIYIYLGYTIYISLGYTIYIYILGIPYIYISLGYTIYICILGIPYIYIYILGIPYIYISWVYHIYICAVLCLVAQWCPVLCDLMNSSLPRLLCPGDFPGKNAGVGCHFLFQWIFLTQGWNMHLLR